VEGMRKAVVPLVVAVVGFGAGAMSGIRTRNVTETRTVTRETLPADCGRALTLAGDGLGFAQQAVALGRAAMQGAAASSSSSPPGASSPSPAPPTGGPGHPPSDAIFGEAMSRLLFVQRQYLEARSACDAAFREKKPGERTPAPAPTSAPSPTQRR
jgi:hypothetical protein